MADKVKAPFTPERVESLNNYQRSGAFHPFTCERCRDELGIYFVRGDDGELRRAEAEDAIGADPLTLVIDDHELVATERGWTCRTCDYTQDWAWAFMADGSWHRAASEMWMSRGGDD